MSRARSILDPAAEFVQMRIFFAAAAALVAFSLLAGCTAKKEVVRQPEIEPYRGPVTVEALKQSIGFGAVRTIKALAEVKVSRNGKPAGSFNGVFGYKSPDSLKTIFFGPLGLTVMEMHVSHELLQVSLPTKNALYEMKSPEIAFSSLLDESRFRLDMQEEGDFYALYAYAQADTSPVPVMKYLFDRVYLLNRRIILYRTVGEAVVISFDSFNGRVPEQIGLLFSNGTDVEIGLQETELNTDIPDEFFSAIEHGDMNVRPFRELLKRLAPAAY